MEDARNVIEELQEDLKKILTDNKDKVHTVKGTYIVNSNYRTEVSNVCLIWVINYFLINY